MTRLNPYPLLQRFRASSGGVAWTGSGLALSSVATLAANLYLVANASMDTYGDFMVLTFTLLILGNIFRLGADRIFVGEVHAAERKGGPAAAVARGGSILAFALLSGLVAGAQAGERCTDRLLQGGRERLDLDPAADLRAGDRQRANVFGVERRQPLLDAVGQAGVSQELAERVGGGGEAGGHAHARGQLGDHLAEAGVLAADRLDVAHSQVFKRNDQGGRFEQCRHGKTPEVET